MARRRRIRTARRRFRKDLWTGDDSELWIQALAALDDDLEDGLGDDAKDQLIELLKSEQKAMPFDARWHLADFLERKQIKNQRWRRTPSYYVYGSETVQRLERAKAAAHEAMKNGTERDQAFEDEARKAEIKLETLLDYDAGRYNSARRMKNRRPPAKKTTPIL